MDLEALAKEKMDRISDIILGYPWEDPVAYGLWLTQTYCMVAHSTRLVALAGACTPLGREELHGRFVDHSKEERGHQLVCVADLKNLGYKLEDFPKTFQAQAMYQIQYYWIQNCHAASFFGYTLALECLAERFGPELSRRVVKAHGQKASKFLVLHSEADQGHTQEAYKYLKTLNEFEASMVKENLILSSDIYRSMLIESQQILKEIKVPQKKAAA